MLVCYRPLAHIARGHKSIDGLVPHWWVAHYSKIIVQCNANASVLIRVPAAMLLTLPLLLAASRDRSIRHAVAGDAHGRAWPAGDASDDAATGTWRRDAVAATAAWALWIAEVNLCPFARKSLETSDAISYVVTEADNQKAFYAAAVDCARDLAKSSDAVDPTAAIVFLVAPFYEARDFPAFLRSVEALEDDSVYVETQALKRYYLKPKDSAQPAVEAWQWATALCRLGVLPPPHSTAPASLAPIARRRPDPPRAPRRMAQLVGNEVAGYVADHAYGYVGERR